MRVLLNIMIIWLLKPESAKGFDLLFPTSQDIQWSELNPNVIDCFRDPDQMRITNGVGINGYSPKLQEHYHVKGFLCSKNEYSTKCAEGFSGERR